MAKKTETNEDEILVDKPPAETSAKPNLTNAGTVPVKLGAAVSGVGNAGQVVMLNRDDPAVKYGKIISASPAS